ncbi:dihydrofolate reductase [Choanephora cucurbitarum]|nr:dihydrofolate reductase [Choanephora cucurbitarum]
MAAALAKNGGIGYRHALPWHIPGDWSYFERVTTKPYRNAPYKDSHIDHLSGADYYNVVILGRQTFESKPMSGIPLENRFNIVVSKNPDYKTPSLTALATSLEEAFELSALKVKANGRVFLLGGEQVYRQSILMPECTHILLTNVYSDIEIVCDAFIPPIDTAVFRLADHEELEAFVEETMPRGKQKYQHFEYEFVLYVRHSLA